MNKLVTITNKDYIDVIKKEDVTLVYPLKTFSVGYEEYFDIDKIDLALSKFGKDINYRAENITLEEFIMISNELIKQ